VLCLHNVSGQAQGVDLRPDELGLTAGAWHDLLSGETVIVGSGGLTMTLLPYGVRLLKV
jgi:hypothetical protein